jgi:hypothetical protein
VFAAASACGTLEMRDLKDSFGKKSSVSDNNDGDMVEVRVGLSRAANYGSNLVEGWEPLNVASVNSTKFFYKVTGCKSGYAVSNATEVSSYEGTFNLYKYDKSCSVSLVSFNYDGKLFKPTDGVDLGGIAGSNKLFWNDADHSEIVRVKVLKQLPSGSGAGSGIGVVDGDAAHFTFMRYEGGGAATLATYNSSVTGSVTGIEVPNISGISLAITDINSTTGIATYKATMTCDESLVASGADWLCKNSTKAYEHNLSDMKIKIITRDPNITYGLEDMEDEMASGTSDISGNSKDGTSTFSVSNLAGEGQFINHRQLLVIISYTEPSDPSEGTSYISFTADYGNP